VTRRPLLAGLGVLVLTTAVACGQKAAPDVDPQVQRPGPSSTLAPSTTTTTAPTTTTTVDPGTLPQTQDRPDPNSPELRARIELLWHGIAGDDPAAAKPAFFPLSAYLQVKDLRDPVTDWNNRLIGAYDREIRALHKQLATQITQQKATPAEVQFVRLDIPAGGVQWMNPGSEYNKVGYFRVLDSKLHYTVKGKAYTFNVKSMISWRGQWYVVHLTSF
jgi:hypothetical protein